MDHEEKYCTHGESMNEIQRQVIIDVLDRIGKGISFREAKEIIELVLKCEKV